MEDVTFVSDDPAFAGRMILTTRFVPVADGTRVTIAATDVPPGIGRAEHEEGIAQSLRNLARLTE